MTAKERLRQLVEELSDREARAALELVKRNLDARNEAPDRELDDDRPIQESEALDRAIIEGYRRRPPSDPWGDSAARHLIEAEPW